MYTAGDDVPRKGNVDRNSSKITDRDTGVGTFPARGTWIEMLRYRAKAPGAIDVPRKGNVDRNSEEVLALLRVVRRSPQGERG